jgi:putative salt-induced outer membrane protein
LNSKTIALWLISVVCVSAQAQDGSGGDDDPIEGAASLGYLATSGNTDSTNLSASFNLVYSGTVWSHEFDVSTVSAETDGVTTAEAHTAGYTGRRAFGERSYLFTALNWQKDRFSAYDQQVSETMGYGRRFISTDAHELNAEFGVGARQADLRDLTSEDEGIWRTRVSSRFLSCGQGFSGTSRSCSATA